MFLLQTLFTVLFTTVANAETIRYFGDATGDNEVYFHPRQRTDVEAKPVHTSHKRHAWHKPGPAGPPGPKGEKGDTGERGLTGEPGPMGERGVRGWPGQPGPKGEQGEQGDRGEMGHPGETGAQGEDGPMGPRGPQGEDGVAGHPGPSGNRGFPGPQGKQGPPGVCGCPSYTTKEPTGYPTKSPSKSPTKYTRPTWERDDSYHIPEKRNRWDNNGQNGHKDHRQQSHQHLPPNYQHQRHLGQRHGHEHGQDDRHHRQRHGQDDRHPVQKHGHRDADRHHGQRHGQDDRHNGQRHGQDDRQHGQRHGYDIDAGHNKPQHTNEFSLNRYFGGYRRRMTAIIAGNSLSKMETYILMASVLVGNNILLVTLLKVCGYLKSRKDDADLREMRGLMTEMQSSST